MFVGGRRPGCIMMSPKNGDRQKIISLFDNSYFLNLRLTIFMHLAGLKRVCVGRRRIWYSQSI